MLVPEMQAASPFIKDMSTPIYHNLRNVHIIHQFLQHIQPPQGIKHLFFHLHPFLQGQQMFLSVFPRLHGYLHPQLLVTDFSGAFHLLQHLSANFFQISIHPLHSPLYTPPPFVQSWTASKARASALHTPTSHNPEKRCF